MSDWCHILTTVNPSVAVQLTIEKCTAKARMLATFPGLIVKSCFRRRCADLARVAQFHLRRKAPKFTPKRKQRRKNGRTRVDADSRHGGDNHTITNGCQKARKYGDERVEESNRNTKRANVSLSQRYVSQSFFVPVAFLARLHCSKKHHTSNFAIKLSVMGHKGYFRREIPDATMIGHRPSMLSKILRHFFVHLGMTTEHHSIMHGIRRCEI